MSGIILEMRAGGAGFVDEASLTFRFSFEASIILEMLMRGNEGQSGSQFHQRRGGWH